MVEMYDALFDWLKAKVNPAPPIFINENYGGDITHPLVSDKLKELPYKGLEMLVGHSLVVSNTFLTAGNAEDIFCGDDCTLVGQMHSKPSFQIFEVPDGLKAATGTILPLVARIDRIDFPQTKTKEVFIVTYWEAAQKYLKT